MGRGWGQVFYFENPINYCVQTHIIRDFNILVLLISLELVFTLSEFVCCEFSLLVGCDARHLECEYSHGTIEAVARVDV